MTKQLYLLVDPIENLFGSIRPVVLLAEEFSKSYDITIVTPKINKEPLKLLEEKGYKIIITKKKLYTKKSLATLEAWFRKEKFEVKENGKIIINFSQCYYGKCDIYYAQGPISEALKDISSEVKFVYKLGYYLFKWIINYEDKKFINSLRKNCKLFIANSFFCAEMYKKLGIKVDDIIYPPLDTRVFYPRTNNPEEDYVLTYFGKETKYSTIKTLADIGIKIKAFGTRAPYIPKSLLSHPNVEYVGKISDDELAELYSNALVTIFTFTHEPFGYIPVESMACGTPVITYNSQGPKESVKHGKTGWLVNNDQELIKLVKKIWNEGFPKEMRKYCVEEAKKYDKSVIAKQWLRFLS